MNAIRLTHCGIAVDHFRGAAPLFSDTRTDDPLTHCVACGKPLQAALEAGEMKLADGAVYQVKRRRAPAPRPQTPARDAAVALVRQAVAELRGKQRARAAA